MDLSKFTQAQQEAIRFGDGPLLVSAGPGSGKTTVLTQRLVHMTEELHLPEDKILVISFTRAASVEMRERFLRLKGSPSNISFGTFHAAFWRILRLLQPELRLSVLQENEKKQILRSYLLQGGGSVSEDMIAQTENFIKRYDRERNEGRQGSAFFCAEGTEDEKYHSFIRFFEQEKERLGRLDFEDMQSLLLKLLQDKPEALCQAQSLYTYFLIDEFQDINRIQYDILRLLSANSPNVFAVGDEDQSIYGFRGSDPGFLLNFQKDFPGAKIIGLYENFRSSARIVAYSKKFIEVNRKRLPKDFHSVRGGGSEVAVIGCKSLREENFRLRDTLLAMHQQGLPYKDMAVLYRTHAQNKRFRKILEEAAIPFYCPEESLSLWQHPLIETLLAYLRLAADPSDTASFLVCGKSLKLPAACLEEAASSRQPLDALINLPALSLLVRSRIEELNYRIQSLQSLATVSAQLAHLWQRADFAHEALDFSRNQFESAERINEVLAFAFDTAEGQKSAEDWLQAMRVRDIGEGVCLSTMHAAKGLEFCLVWCAAISRGVMPHPEALASEEGEEEERRVMYVAMTRAKDYLYLSGLVRKRAPFCFRKHRGRNASEYLS